MPKDYETHPAFGWVQVSRVSSGGGVPLFDSELKHSHFVEVRISGAQRARDLNQDWIMGDSQEHTVLRMSMAQWGALVSSFGSSGVPVTVERLNGEAVESLEYEPRMAESLKEIDGATGKLVEAVEKAAAAVQEAFDAKAGRKEMAEKIRGLAIALQNSRPNAKFVAEQFAEHVENTVTKARADIEAMVQIAAQRGLEAGADQLLALPVANDDEIIDVEEG